MKIQEAIEALKKTKGEFEYISTINNKPVYVIEVEAIETVLSELDKLQKRLWKYEKEKGWVKIYQDSYRR
jgi:hypothetical protein